MNEEVLVTEIVHCPRCGQDKPAHHINKHLCIDCTKAENVRLTYYRQHQDDWLTVAKESNISVWLQQPGETQWEYTVWTAYRDSYPGKKPVYSDVAKQLNTTYNVVRKIAQRWSFPVRMQMWMRNCDDITMLQRRQEILNMNKEHISMAKTLREKINVAIDNIDPNSLKPGEISSLAKLATEMERKARVDTIAQEEMRNTLLVDSDNIDVKKSPTKQADITAVIQILNNAGALGDFKQLGIRQTTEVIVKEE